MKKVNKNKKQRVASIKRGKKRGDRAKQTINLKSERRALVDKLLAQEKFKQDLWIKKIQDSRILEK
jgi:hypothetical protein